MSLDKDKRRLSVGAKVLNSKAKLNAEKQTELDLQNSCFNTNTLSNFRWADHSIPK